MRILDRYIGQAVQTGVLAVLGVALSLFLLVNFLNEFEKVGRADYTVWNAAAYVLLWLPKLGYQVFPLAALMGTMLGLGVLANHSELVVIRAAGISKLRVALSVTKAMLALIVIAFIVGEVVAPPAEQYAEQMRLRALSSKVSFNQQFGLWVRDENTYIHVQSVDVSNRLLGVDLYLFDDKRKLQRRIQAKSAVFDGMLWQLQDVTETVIDRDGVRLRHHATFPWQTVLDTELVDTVSYNPDSLSIWNQVTYIDYLKSNGLDSRIYELALWNKIVAPFTIMAMVLLAVPFAFSSQRKASMGKRIVIGFVIGVVFYIASQLTGQMGLVYDIPPFLSASIPTLLVLVFALWQYKRLH